MGIYRGAGGTGDAVADASSEASLIKELAVEVQADADAASASAAAALVSENNAETAATNAQTAETNAETAEANAETAQAAAEAAQSAAETAEANAETAQAAAATSATNAASSASSASTSATAAASSASTATTQATNASNSASAASTSATNASNSASAASTSAANAASSATAAAGSATAASNSASSAASSESNASTSATNAASSASTATTQAGIATTQATNAASSASAASTSATNAASSATAAAGSATSASNSASTATTQATNASNSASAAATSATNAANSATAAATSEANAAATLANALVKTNNLSDLSNTATARTNLGVAIGSNVQAYSSQLTSYATNGVAMKNRIINGAGLIAQRTTGTTTADAGGTAYPIDRFRCFANGGGVFTAAQSSTAPAGSGFVKSVYMTVTTPDSSISSSDYYSYSQYIEGLNTTDLEWGTANAKTVTVSFWCRSSVTGTYVLALTNQTGTRGYPATFTISVANTWQQVSLTIAGCTDGVWATDNSTSIIWRLDLGSGSGNNGTANIWNSSAGAYTGLRTSASTNWISTSGATFYITGVQLEVGSSATGFEYRHYGTELTLCQRYYYKQINYMGQSAPYNSEATGARGTSILANANIYRVCRPHPVQMRTTPTVSYANVQIWDGVVQNTVNSITNNNSSLYARSLDYAMSGNGGGSGLTAAEFVMPSGYIDCSAEL